MSLSSHQSANMKSDEWLTPPEIISKLGTFDLDPCAPIERPWPMAKHHYTINDNGLLKPWFGRVWLNPPFGKEVEKWLAIMASHRNGIALIAARTETKMFFRFVWDLAIAVCFVKGRPHFYKTDGNKAQFNSGAPICLIAYDFYSANILTESNLGKTIFL